MPITPENLPSLFIGAVIGAWVLSITGIFVLRWHYSKRLERLGESTSEEMVGELNQAYKPASRVRIQTQTEYLPFVIETIRENIDNGLAEPQVQLLLERIEGHRVGIERHAMFPVESNQRPGDLRLSWICDAHHRIDLRVQADPTIVRALRELKRNIPKAAMYGQAGYS